VSGNADITGFLNWLLHSAFLEFFLSCPLDFLKGNYIMLRAGVISDTITTTHVDNSQKLKL